MSDVESEERREPSYKRALLEEAKHSQEPVTEVDVKDNGVTLVHAVQMADGVAYRAKITHCPESDGSPQVTFARSVPGSDVSVIRDWSDVAVGRMSGPKDLPSWERLFTVFNAALGEFNSEVRSEEGDAR